MMAQFRLLMVDDQPTEIEQMQSVIKAEVPEVAEVRGARHAREALELLASNSFHLILLDQQWLPGSVTPEELVDEEGRLPGRTQDWDHQGFHIMRLLRKTVDLPIVFCTRVGTLQSSLEATAAGAHTYYSKEDLLANPHWVLYPLTGGLRDMAFLRRELDGLRMDADAFARQWFVGQRLIWGRQWPGIVSACLERLSAQGLLHVSIRDLTELELRLLPSVLEEHRESVCEADLVELLSRRGLPAKEARRCDPFWLVNTEDPQCPLLMVVDPGHQRARPLLPADWDVATSRWHADHPSIIPTNLHRWALGEDDPYWGVTELFALAPIARDDVPDLRQFVPFLERTGQTDGLDREDWSQLIDHCRQLENAAVWSRAVSIPAAYFLRGDDASENVATVSRETNEDETEDVETTHAEPRDESNDVEPKDVEAQTKDVETKGAETKAVATASVSSQNAGTEIAAPETNLLSPVCLVVPVPDQLLTRQAIHREKLSPLGQVYRLHFGTVPEHLPADGSETQLDLLTQVTVYRGPSVDAFEEQTLRVVLEVLAQVIPTTPGPWFVWLGCDFLRLRFVNPPRLLAEPSEFDVLILGPPGICLLECKGSLKLGDFDRGRDQLISRYQFIWAKEDQKHPQGGIFLRPVLARRLQNLNNQTSIPDDILQAVPESLAGHLRSRTVKEARQRIQSYYQPLEPLKFDHWQRLTEDVLSRRKTSVVLGTVVVPDALGQAQLADYMARIGKDLPGLLARWARRKALLLDPAFDRVSDALHHLAYSTSRSGLRQVYGFTPQTRCADLADGWQVFSGQADVTQVPQTTLLHTFEGPPEMARVHQYGHWQATVLGHWPCEFRWLDVRGLPPEDKRHIRRIAIVVQGELATAADLLTWEPPERLAAVEVLWRLGSDPAVRSVLGQSDDPPQPVAQRFLAGQPWRWAWLPPHPLAKRGASGVRSAFRLAPARLQRKGLRHVVTALLELVDHSAEVLLAPVADLLRSFRKQLQGSRGPVPDPHLVVEALAAARHLADAVVSSRSVATGTTGTVRSEPSTRTRTQADSPKSEDF